MPEQTVLTEFRTPAIRLKSGRMDFSGEGTPENISSAIVIAGSSRITICGATLPKRNAGI